MSETDLEKACTAYAVARHCKVRKVKGRAGMFDRQIWVPVHASKAHYAFVWFIEFKNPNGRGVMSELQKLERKWLDDSGFLNHVIDNQCEFVDLFNLLVH